MKTLSRLALLTALVLLASALIPATPSVADRRLSRVLEEAGYGEDGTEAVEKAYQTAMQAGYERRKLLSLAKLCVKGGFGAHETARVFNLAAQLSLAGLPGEGFESKIKEGVAKRVAPARILVVGEKWALAVNRARKTLNSLILTGYDIGGHEELLPAVAHAFEAGKGEREVREILVSALENGDNERKIRRRLLR